MSANQFPQSHSAERSDGSMWTEYELPSVGILLLTSAGKDLLRDKPEVRGVLRDYRREAAGMQAGSIGVRTHFASGGNSDVYRVGDESLNLVMKEASKAQAAYGSFNRMDELKAVTQQYMPRWFDIPDHYAMLDARGLDRQYILMEAIDHGITLEDVRQGEARQEDQLPEKTKHFLRSIDETQIEAIDRLAEQAKAQLSAAIYISGSDPRDLLTDWHEGNILVEPLTTPVAGSFYKLNLIDQ